ncbi:hypothetical protein Csa_003007, partial [Cucumis sativus]
MLGPTNAINEVGPSFCYANGEEEEPMTAIAAWDEFSFPPSVVFQPIKPLENKKKEHPILFQTSHFKISSIIDASSEELEFEHPEELEEQQSDREEAENFEALGPYFP